MKKDNSIFLLSLAGIVVSLNAITPAQAQPGKVRVLNEKTVTSTLSDAHVRFENAMSRLPEVLDEYTPQGIKFSNKKVAARDAKTTTLEMDVSSMGFDAHWDSFAWVEMLAPTSCPARDKAQLVSARVVRMNLLASDSLIRDNVSESKTKICAYSLEDGSSAFVATFSVVEGSDRSIITGPSTESLLSKQSDPILKAVRQVAGI